MSPSRIFASEKFEKSSGKCKNTDKSDSMKISVLKKKKFSPVPNKCILIWTVKSLTKYFKVLINVCVTHESSNEFKHNAVSMKDSEFLRQINLITHYDDLCDLIYKIKIEKNNNANLNSVFRSLVSVNLDTLREIPLYMWLPNFSYMTSEHIKVVLDANSRKKLTEFFLQPQLHAYLTNNNLIDIIDDFINIPGVNEIYPKQSSNLSYLLKNIENPFVCLSTINKLIWECNLNNCMIYTKQLRNYVYMDLNYLFKIDDLQSKYLATYPNFNFASFILPYISSSLLNLIEQEFNDWLHFSYLERTELIFNFIFHYIFNVVDRDHRLSDPIVGALQAYLSEHHENFLWITDLPYIIYVTVIINKLININVEEKFQNLWGSLSNLLYYFLPSLKNFKSSMDVYVSNDVYHKISLRFKSRLKLYVTFRNKHKKISLAELCCDIMEYCLYYCDFVLILGSKETYSFRKNCLKLLKIFTNKSKNRMCDIVEDINQTTNLFKTNSVNNFINEHNVSCTTKNIVTECTTLSKYIALYFGRFDSLIYKKSEIDLYFLHQNWEGFIGKPKYQFCNSYFKYDSVKNSPFSGIRGTPIVDILPYFNDLRKEYIKHDLPLSFFSSSFSYDVDKWAALNVYSSGGHFDKFSNLLEKNKNFVEIVNNLPTRYYNIVPI